MASPAAPRFNVNAIVAQVIGTLQQGQSQTTPPPADMPADLLATIEILGQGPGPGRPLGAAGNAVFDAWGQAAAAEEHVTILRGNGQVALVGTAVRFDPAIAITDGFGRPSQGVSLTSDVKDGGSVAIAAPVTDQEGIAATGVWTLGSTPGLNRLQLKVQRAVKAEFVAFGVPTRRCDIYDGDGQHAAHDTAVRIEPKVRVVDARTGQPLPDLGVTFTPSAGGNVDNPTAMTDGDGIATAGLWTLGPAGTNTLVAEVDEADPVVFTAEATP